MRYEEYEYCMKVKCKHCSLDGACQHLDKVYKILTYKPFEELEEIINKKNKKNKTSKKS